MRDVIQKAFRSRVERFGLFVCNCIACVVVSFGVMLMLLLTGFFLLLLEQAKSLLLSLLDPLLRFVNFLLRDLGISLVGIHRIWAQVFSCAVDPGFGWHFSHASALIVVADLHGAFVLVVQDSLALGYEPGLLLHLVQSPVRADIHDIVLLRLAESLVIVMDDHAPLVELELPDARLRQLIS